MIPIPRYPRFAPSSLPALRFIYVYGYSPRRPGMFRPFLIYAFSDYARLGVCGQRAASSEEGVFGRAIGPEKGRVICRLSGRERERVVCV